MSENNSNRPMRWDEHARGGAGGWVPASEDRPGPPPDAPDPDPGDEPGGGRRALPRKYVILLAVGGGLAVAAVTLVIAHAVRPSAPEAGPTTEPSSSSSPSRSLPASTAADPQPAEAPTGTAEEQATAVDELLERSTSDRQQVIDAVNAVEACASDESVDSAGQVLDAAAVRRESLITGLAELDLGELASGSDAAGRLRTGWQHSADADRAFADWADDARGCSPGAVPRTSSYHQGVRSSELATGAKEDFVALWTPIAARYGLPERDTAQL
ncbi:hypothetical protein ACFYQ5_18015 [Streptomyces sp. NPDC005794]|uniref:hypothetical protein n=1 Tax=Streptomyces sp. NPDC005794 TaxID=3364733 RepID=UPI00368F0D68